MNKKLCGFIFKKQCQTAGYSNSLNYVEKQYITELTGY